MRKIKKIRELSTREKLELYRYSLYGILISLIVGGLFYLFIFSIFFFIGSLGVVYRLGIADKVSFWFVLILGQILPLTLVVIVIVGAIIAFSYGRRRLKAQEIRQIPLCFKIILESGKYSPSQVKEAIEKLFELEVLYNGFLEAELRAILKRDRRKSIRELVQQVLKKYKGSGK